MVDAQPRVTWQHFQADPDGGWQVTQIVPDAPPMMLSIWLSFNFATLSLFNASLFFKFTFFMVIKIWVFAYSFKAFRYPLFYILIINNSLKLQFEIM